MEKKFAVLRIIGTIWKILAWIVLITGLLTSIGTLLAGVLGLAGPLLRGARIPGDFQAFGLVGGVAGFVFSLIVTVVWFLSLYAAGDFIYLALAIEENTRLTARWIQWTQQQARPTPSPPAYSPPPPPPFPTPQPPPPPTPET